MLKKEALAWVKFFKHCLLITFSLRVSQCEGILSLGFNVSVQLMVNHIFCDLKNVKVKRLIIFGLIG